MERRRHDAFPVALQHRQLVMLQHRPIQSGFRLDHVGSIGLGHVFGERLERDQNAVGRIAALGLLLRQLREEQRLISEGLVALCLRSLLVRYRDPSLPVSHPRQSTRDHGDSDCAACPTQAPSTGRALTRCHELELLRRWFGRRRGPRIEPRLRFAESSAPEQEIGRLVCVLPIARRVGELGMLAYPIDIGPELLDQALYRGIEVAGRREGDVL